VTTTAVGLAMRWPGRSLLVEADPTGGQAVQAGFFRGTATVPGGLIDLPMAVEQGVLAAVIDRLAVGLPGSAARLLAGIESPRQMAALPELWEPLGRVLRTVSQVDGVDVLVDAGRLGLAASPTALLADADVVLLVTRSDLVAVAAARAWLPLLQGTCSGVLGLAVVGPGRPHPAREVAAALGVPVLAGLAWDPRSAAVFSHGTPPGRRFAGSPLVRSLQATHAALEAAVAVEDALAEAGEVR
jgi:hypothetical protein